MKTLKHYGELNSVKTVQGKIVTRKEKIFVKELNYAVPCAGYDNQFVFENPDKRKNTIAFLCTCGSPGVVVGYDAYKKDASMSGAMFVCMHHAQNGKHMDGSS